MKQTKTMFLAVLLFGVSGGYLMGLWQQAFQKEHRMRLERMNMQTHQNKSGLFKRQLEQPIRSKQGYYIPERMKVK